MTGGDALSRGKQVLQSGQLPHALALLRQAVLEAPKSAEARYFLAAALARSDDLEGAIRELTEAVTLSPTTVQLWLQLGALYQRGNRPVEAARCFRSVLRLQPEHPQAQQALGALPKEAVEAAIAEELPQIDLTPLIEALAAPDAAARQEAARALGETRHPDAARPLIPLLQDPDEAVRCAAALALGRLGRLEAVEPLLPMLEEGTPHERAVAAEALGMVDQLAAVEPLIEALHDPNDTVRRAVAAALGTYPTHQAADALLGRLRWDQDPETRVAAAQALGRIGDPESVSRLMEAQTDGDPRVREAVRAALGQIAGQRASADTPEARLTIAIAEGRYDEVRGAGLDAVRPLLAALDRGDERAGETLREIIEGIGLVPGPDARTHATDPEPLIALSARLLYDNPEAVEQAVEGAERLAGRGDRTGVLALEIAYRIRSGQWTRPLFTPRDRHEPNPDARAKLKELAQEGRLHEEPRHTQELLAGVIATGLPAGLEGSITGRYDGPDYLALKLLLSHLLVHAALAHR